MQQTTISGFGASHYRTRRDSPRGIKGL